MRAGTLKSRVTLQSLVEGQDEIGQPVTTWVDVATVWADIRHVSGLEAVKAGAVTSTVKASIRIRYRAGINAGMQVVHGATEYNIVAVLPDVAGKQFVDLVAEIVQ